MADSGLLQRIVITKHKELALIQRRTDKAESFNRGFEHAFLRALAGPEMAFIAEIKRKSPSSGSIRPDLDVQDIARLYTDAGASAISVLTDSVYFGGSFDDIQRVKSATDLPVLCKDFIIHPRQLKYAKQVGADAALLIVRLLEESQLAELLLAADTYGLDALVETHSESEMDQALRAGATLIGVNCRDLESLTIDPDHHLRMSYCLPKGVIAVAESGIHFAEDVHLRAQAGYAAVLVGTRLMRAACPGAALSALTVYQKSGVCRCL